MSIYHYISVLLLSLLLASTAVADSVLDWFSSPAAPASMSSSKAKWKFSHPAPPASTLIPIMRQGLARLNMTSQGKFTFKEYGGGSLHGPTEAFRALRRNITDYAICYGALEANGFEYTKAITQYGVSAENPLITTRILAELAPQYFAPEFEAKGVYFLASAASAPSRIFTKTPVHSVSDLKGLKIITHGVPPETAKHYGYTPINIPFTETYTALQQGIADGVIGIDPAFIAFKIYEVVNHLTLVNMAGGAVDLCVNRKSFDRLSAQNKAVLYELQQPLMMAVTKKVVSDIGIRSQAIYKKLGVNLISPTPNELKEWDAIGIASRTPWLSKCKSKGKDCAKLLHDIETLKQKYRSYTDDQLMDLAVNKPVRGIVSTYLP